MKRFLFLSLLLLAATLAWTQRVPKVKNVLVILADDHALKVTGTYGNSTVRTPSLDRFSRESLTFTRAYCNAPICSASRQSILTGKYPHATGVNLLFTPFPDEGNTTMAEHLKTQGYRTAIIGKTHWNNWAWSSLYQDGLPTHGFDVRIEGGEYNQFLKENPPPPVPAGTDVYSREAARGKGIGEWMNYRALPHPIDDAHSSGTFYAQQAIEFMKNSGDTPFFVWLAFKEPHHPYYFPLEYAGKYDPADMPLPEGSPEDDRWVPEKYKNMTEEEKRGIIAAYYTSTEYLDKNVGLVLDALEAQGLADETVVIYLSDNGYLLYEHKRFEKHTMWEEAIRQPMMVRVGSTFRPGQRTDALVEYIDVAPTLFALLGVPALEEVQGKSFVDLLARSKQAHKEFAMATYLEDNLAMVCDKRWKYVFTTGSRDLGIGYRTGLGPSGMVHRLYDLENDPLEQRSVADEPENAEVLLRMQQAMLQRFMETHPDADRCPQGLTLEGKLVWFCEPRDVGVDQSLEDVPVRVFEKE